MKLKPKIGILAFFFYLVQKSMHKILLLTQTLCSLLLGNAVFLERTL